jgi:SHS2 domain-containing protein
MHKDFEQISHTADIKIRVYGTTLQELFKHALIGMFQSIGPHAQGCTTVDDRLQCPSLPQKHEIDITSVDREALLVDFLSEAWYLSDVNDEAYLDADIHELTDTHIRATVHGVKITQFDVVEIKAVTYHDLAITQVDGQWQTDIVFDI